MLLLTVWRGNVKPYPELLPPTMTKTKKKNIFLDLSDKHLKLIVNSEQFKKFKSSFNPLIRHKRYTITPGDFLREHVISYYRGKKKKINPKEIAEFQRSKAITGKIKFTLPEDVMEKFEFDCKSNLRSLKSQALYLVIPLINQLKRQ